ncbi:phage late control D family protein, partial [Bergeriella denitrificans]
PVTRPDFVIKYEQKDITGEISPYLISFSYTDYLGEQSDELQVEFEDTDGRWLRGWYPEQGDRLSLSMGDQFTGLVDLGFFEIAEIEYSTAPSVVSLKALSTGITKANRTLKPRAYEKTTLAKIVREVAGRLKLKPDGEVRDIKIERVTQYQERDVEFLTRLARQYGHTFK